MQMPRPGAEHERLNRLAGEWVGEEKISPTPFDPAGGNALGRFRSRMALDGFYLISDYEQERGGKIVFRGHGVFGYDAASGTYTMHWFDSMGVSQPTCARGPWESDTNTLRLTYESAEHGASRYVYVLSDEGYRLRIETSKDGHAWTPFLDAKYRRK